MTVARTTCRVIAATLGLTAVLASGAAAGPASSAAIPPGARTVAANGIRIAYRVSGTGSRPLLLVNGSGATLDTWDPALLARLGHTRRVIVFDPRGLAATSGRPGRRLSIALMADDAVALLRALGIRRSDVLGWSLGGFVAQEMGLRHPASVRRLVLVSTDAGGPTARRSSRRVAALDDKATRGQASLDELLSVLFPTSAAASGRAWFTRLLAQPGACCEAFPPAAGQAVVDAEEAWYRRGAGSRPRLSRLQAPVLVTAGDLDVDIPPANGRLISQLAPHARLERFRRAGHALLVQESARFARLVARFLS